MATARTPSLNDSRRPVLIGSHLAAVCSKHTRVSPEGFGHRIKARLAVALSLREISGVAEVLRHDRQAAVRCGSR